MNGVDAIVFTAGIGENAIPVREKVVSYLGYLGVTPVSYTHLDVYKRQAEEEKHGYCQWLFHDSAQK